MLEFYREKIAEVIYPEFAEKRDRLERQANTDALTGLANARVLALLAPDAIKAQSDFILFDANNFGQINKKYGHAEGDAVLRYFADVIANVARNFKARAIRIGGDEFLVIAAPGFGSIVRDAVERRALPKRYEGFTVSISGEVGASVEDADSRLQTRKQSRKTYEKQL